MICPATHTVKDASAVPCLACRIKRHVAHVARRALAVWRRARVRRTRHDWYKHTWASISRTHRANIAARRAACNAHTRASAAPFCLACVIGDSAGVTARTLTRRGAVRVGRTRRHCTKNGEGYQNALSCCTDVATWPIGIRVQEPLQACVCGCCSSVPVKPGRHTHCGYPVAKAGHTDAPSELCPS
jgi:hypothetical protein